MNACPHCGASLPEPAPAWCPSCSAVLADQVRFIDRGRWSFGHLIEVVDGMGRVTVCGRDKAVPMSAIRRVRNRAGRIPA